MCKFSSKSGGVPFQPLGDLTWNDPVQEVKEALSKLKENKAPGVDGIHPKILNRCSSTVCLPLQKIFQMTLVDGSLPRDWKDANVTALHKKGSKSDVGNYRPVSLTSVPCKILVLVQN